MGYAKLGQDNQGIHTRLYARTLIIADQSGTRVCYVNVDLAAATQIVKILVSSINIVNIVLIDSSPQLHSLFNCFNAEFRC